ncbi:hypothetical protein EV13_1993 [Prochlorococcus sp. MIT 0702]|nr:hypothetical protein EV13_1993 [Prochlorococcus sp. MIT 0702]KGG28153.1 hypothetical protein EV12_0902 [Prochlorococcus sp. MIT 0701]KGG30559.1 hypothetical protein EV14_3095 [Prochlorococcus sp. MIT 0703]
MGHQLTQQWQGIQPKDQNLPIGSASAILKSKTYKTSVTKPR